MDIPICQDVVWSWSGRGREHPVARSCLIEKEGGVFNAMTTVLMPLADGFEEMEAIVVADTLRRAALDVTLAGLHAKTVVGSRGVRVEADAVWHEIRPDSFDVLVIPGGMGGVQALSADANVLAAIRAFDKVDKWLAAICAGPLVLHVAGILQGRRVTCHPGVDLPSARVTTERVVVDEHLITSQGPATALEFALTIARVIRGQDVAVKVARDMLANTDF